MRTAPEIIIAALKRGKTNAEALAAVRKNHPRSTVSPATVNWYRNRLRDAGAKIPTDREAKRRKSS